MATVSILLTIACNQERKRIGKDGPLITVNPAKRAHHIRMVKALIGDDLMAYIMGGEGGAEPFMILRRDDLIGQAILQQHGWLIARDQAA